MSELSRQWAEMKGYKRTRMSRVWRDPNRGNRIVQANFVEDGSLAMDELIAWCGKKTGRRFRISGSFVYHFVTLTEDVFATTCSTGEDDNLATAIIQALIKAETAKNA